MALDFSGMQTEVYARGFSYLSVSTADQTRVKRWINDAMHDVDEMEDWPYLQSSTTGIAPVTISDLGRIESVVDVADLTVLEYLDRRTVTDYYADLTTTGQAAYYYLTAGTTVNAYPADSTSVLTVRYYKVAPDLSATGDTPLMPDRFRMAIVEFACAKGYRDSDNPQMAAECRAEGERIVQQMRTRFALQSGGLDEIVVKGFGTDW